MWCLDDSRERECKFLGRRLEICGQGLSTLPAMISGRAAQARRDYNIS